MEKTLAAMAVVSGQADKYGQEDEYNGATEYQFSMVSRTTECSVIITHDITKTHDSLLRPLGWPPASRIPLGTPSYGGNRQEP